MDEDIKVPYDIPGFERRRPQRASEQIPPQANDDPEVIVISSDEEEENPVRVCQARIKIEDIKTDLSLDEFDPTVSPIPNYAASFTNPSPKPNPSPSPNVFHRSFLPPNRSKPRSGSNEPTRIFAAKSTARRFIPTATVQSSASNQTFRAFEPENTTQPFITNDIRRSYTPNGRESVFTKQSTPESGFVDQQFEDYQSEIDRDFILPPQPTAKTVWSSKRGHRGIASNASRSAEQLNSSNSNQTQTIQFTSNEQRQSNVLQTQQPSKTLTLDSPAAERISNCIQQAITSGRYLVVPKKEAISDQEENDLLQELEAHTSSCSSGTMSEPDSDHYNSSQQPSNRKRVFEGISSRSSIGKRRKPSNDSELSSSTNASSVSYRPESDGEYDEDDDDEDLDSTISNETEPMAGASRSPQYDPESDLDSDYEIDGAVDSDGMESEEASTSDSGEYEPEIIERPKNTDTEDGCSESFVPPQGLRNTDKSLYWSSAKAQTCPLCNKRCTGRMVSHFATHHKESEVFVSRISPKMVDLVDGKRSIKTDNRSQGTTRPRWQDIIQTMCVFCEDVKIFHPNYWIDHIRSHTGEYGNCCRLCNKRVSFNNHCGLGTLKKDNFDLRTNDLYAYRCVECNFVQTRYKNIERHLTIQHQRLTVDKKDYKKFMLMPAYQHITEGKLCNPRGERHHDVSRKPQPRCNVQPTKNVSTESGGATKIIPRSIMRIGTQRSSKSNTASNTTQMALKSDPGDEEILLRVHEEYKALEKLKVSNKSPYNIDVRPYILGDYAKKRNINTVMQYALYKCMHEWCMYATNSEAHWQVHMERHLQLMDALSKRKLLTNDYRSELIKFRECCYCGSEAQDKKHSAHQVCHHMEMQHSRNNFQCAFCFYRTVEIDNMVSHMEVHHPSANHEILVYDVHREFQQKDEEILQDGCEQYITKINCRQGKCKRKFVSYSALYAHHKDHATKILQCAYCLTQMKCERKQMQEHLTTKHSGRHFEEFQCVYCEEGYSSVEEIRSHMAEKHASKFLFAGARWNCNTADELQIVYIGDAKDYSTYKLYTCASFHTLNSMDPQELSPNEQFNKLDEIQNTNITAEFCGSLPSISYKFTKKFAEKTFITLERYLNSRSAQTTSAATASSSKPPVNQEKRVQFKLSTPNIDHTKHLNSQNTHRANDKSLNSMVRPNLNHSARPGLSLKSIASESASAHFIGEIRLHPEKTVR